MQTKSSTRPAGLEHQPNARAMCLRRRSDRAPTPARRHPPSIHLKCGRRNRALRNARPIRRAVRGRSPSAAIQDERQESPPDPQTASGEPIACGRLCAAGSPAMRCPRAIHLVRPVRAANTRCEADRPRNRDAVPESRRHDECRAIGADSTTGSENQMPADRLLVATPRQCPDTFAPTPRAAAAPRR